MTEESIDAKDTADLADAFGQQAMATMIAEVGIDRAREFVSLLMNPTRPGTPERKASDAAFRAIARLAKVKQPKAAA